jgi:hypothetical protein
MHEKNTAHESIIIVCGNGKCFRSTPSLSANSFTFMYINKYAITTMDIIRIQREMIARNAIKRSQTAQQLYKLS